MDEKAKILIVEDERIIALETQNKLESLGYDVPAIVSSGEKAVKKAQELCPDLILMDIVLQGEMDGVAAADKIRTHLDIPVVYVTANISDRRLEDIMRTEPFGCLFKPFEDMELRAAIEMALYKYQMEKKLRGSEKGYRALFENAGEAIYVVQDDKIKFANPKAEELYGYSQEELASRPFTDFVHEEDRNMLLERYMRRLKGEKPPGTYSFRVIDKYGDTRWAELNAVEFSWEDRPATLCFHTDITERKQTEEKEKEHHKNIKLLSETAMRFVEFPHDKDIYTFIGEQLQEFTGKDSYIVINTIDAGKSILTTRAVLGTGKFTDKIAKLLGRHPVGMTFDAKDENLSSLSDGKLHLNEEGLYVIFLKIVPKAVCNSIEKLLNIKKIYGIGFTKDNELFGTIVIFLKEGAGELKNEQIIETFTKQASIAVQKRQAEEALRESEEKYRTLAETTNDITFALDLDGNFTYVSPAVEKLTGYSWQDFLGRPFTEFIAPEYEKSTVKRFKDGLAGREVPLHEIEMIHKDGGTVPVELNVSSLPDATGKTTGKIGVARDITARKQAEEEMLKIEERFRTIIESMEDGYYEVDLSGRFTFFNEAMRRIANVPTRKFIGTSYLEYADPETAKKMYKTFNKVYRTGIPADVEDYEVIRMDGSKRILEFNASLVRDEKGEPAGLRGIARDVTKRKEMEALLAESEERYRNLVENMSEIIYIADEKGIVTYVSHVTEQVSGFKPSEITGRPLMDFLHPEDVPSIADQFKEILSGIIEPKEYRLLTKSNEIIWFRTHAIPIYQNGRVIGIQGILTDITDIKKAEEEINSHQEHLALINQILRHDLTNDLVVIRSAISLYKDFPEEELLEEISSHAEKSAELIKRMGGLETFISTHRELKVCEIRDVIDEIIKSYAFIDFAIKGKARVMADDSVCSVIDNIVRNAVIHGKVDRIIIDIGKEKDMCEVRIADNGVGIPDEIKEKIFEEGFMHGDTGHTGIGLHIVEKAMESYGGYAWIEDNEPKGTVFALRFRRVR